MEPNGNKSPVWQPLTFGGVASFARASWGRLLLVQLIFAIAVAGSVMFALKTTWFVAVREAVKALPDKGAIQSGQLDWTTHSPLMLSEGRFLTILVNLDHDGQSGQVADLQLELGRSDFKLSSVAGETVAPYDKAWTIPVNRQELEPWWGAWEPAIVTGVGLAVIASLFAGWLVLALLYAIPARIITFYGDREANYASCCRLAAAALLPGALLMSVAIFLYAVRQLPLLGLGIILCVHLVVGWLYVLWTPFLVPKQAAKPGEAGNPFGATTAPATPAAPAAPPPPANPFKGGGKTG